MTLLRHDSKLCDVLLHEPSAITIINRFGIYLGVGDLTIGAICRRHDVDTDFFLAILNTYLNEEYFPESALMSVKINLIIDYLRKTNDYYMKLQLPNIERHFNSLVSRSDNAGNLDLLRRFFLEMKHELMSRIETDNDIRFPMLERLEKGDEIEVSGALRSTLLDDCETHIEDKIDDLMSFFIIHLEQPYDKNLCFAVISAVSTLKKDINQNNRIRSRILHPLTKALLQR